MNGSVSPFGRQHRHQYRNQHERLRTEQHRNAESDVRRTRRPPEARRMPRVTITEKIAQSPRIPRSRALADDRRDEVGVRLR
jgi:hypothetical protein